MSKIILTDYLYSTSHLLEHLNELKPNKIRIIISAHTSREISSPFIYGRN